MLMGTAEQPLTHRCLKKNLHKLKATIGSTPYTTTIIIRYSERSLARLRVCLTFAIRDGDGRCAGHFNQGALRPTCP